ncbi:hypothetical protein GIB67_023469 [Kingdonia uniflora]|uniref:No apical meristem-associated C-terminal domain-containing protein n=1 Tax=Kingdonia uniflora TaxID=39325 RepID=A0A7J7PAG7_9MAGN|nr:hypothetical protein GIB67_023469 [Kingdonia uniflora]
MAAEMFLDGERVPRTVSSLKSHWSYMNRACKVYGTCLKNVMQGPISGMQEGNLGDVAKTIYEARDKARNVRMKQISSSSPGMSTPTTPDTPVSFNTDSPVLVMDVKMECPGGFKSDKLKEKNEKKNNLLIERQNILISRLDRMEMKKEEYIAKRDKKKEEYISERDKKKKEREARIMELRERKTKAVVNLEA